MSAESVETYLELRCPLGPRALLAKVVQLGDTPKYTPDNLMELSCRDCTKALRKSDTHVVRVLHRFNILGELVQSVVQKD